MTDLRTAAQQALEALAIGQDAAHEVAQTYHEAMAGYRPARHIAVDDDVRKIEDAITALRAALAEPVQEPVAIVGTQEDTWKGYGGQWAPPGPPIKTVHMLRELPEGTLLYAAPPQRKPLTEWQINDLMANIDPEDVDSWSFRQGVYAAEKHHGVRK